MRGRGIARFFVHTVTVETKIGGGSNGDIFSNPVPVSGVLVEDGVKLVRDRNGDEAVSNTQIAGPLSIAAQFPVGARVTTATRTALVITTATADVPGLPEHTVIHLT